MIIGDAGFREKKKHSGNSHDRRKARRAFARWEEEQEARDASAWSDGEALERLKARLLGLS